MLNYKKQNGLTICSLNENREFLKKEYASSPESSYPVIIITMMTGRESKRRLLRVENTGTDIKIILEAD